MRQSGTHEGNLALKDSGDRGRARRAARIAFPLFADTAACANLVYTDSTSSS
ncbi:unnamed protein product [Periconia digitata]|uniref:Uncharacterized protein n=1 Tax=Periconia digitata TaxID=1303443 RepID=A0A9W4USC7_9PLEO|nr:unnamed protein product [Periconia digitata]